MFAAPGGRPQMSTPSSHATRSRRRSAARTRVAELAPDANASGLLTERSREAADARDGQTLRLTVPGAAAHVATVRRTACAFAECHGVERLADVALAVGEASANVVLHAYRDRTPGPLHLTGFVDRETAFVYLVVADEGSGLAPRLNTPGLGLGLPLIARLTDRFEITEHPEPGTLLTMGFACTPSPEAVEHEISEQARGARDALWLSAWATIEHQRQS